MKSHLKFLLLFHAVFLISYRKILIICSECIIGHNWDWGFPALDFHFRRLYEVSTFTWFSFNFGSGLFLNISQLIPNFLVSLLAYVFSPKYVIILILYVVHLAAFVFIKRLMDIFVKKNDLNYILSFLYAFSPFLFNEIIGGSWYMWISFAAIPLFFSGLYLYIKEGKQKDLLAFIVTSVFVIPSLQNIVLIETIFFFLFCYEVAISKNKPLLLKRYLLAHLLLFFFNLYFILPFLTSLFSLLTYTSKSEFSGNFDSFIHLTQNILGIFSLSGYLDRNMYQFVFSGIISKIWYTVIVSTWIWFLFILKKEKIKNRYFYVFLLIFLASILIVKGGLPPFSKLTLLVFRHVPLFSLYRSPQHLMLAPAFLIPLLLSFAVQASSISLLMKSRLLYVVVFIWISGWWINGDLGQRILLDQKKDHVDFFRLSPSLKDSFTFNENSLPDYRTVFLPTVLSPQYLKTEYQNEAQGGQAEFMLLKSPTFSAEISVFAQHIDDYFCFKSQTSPIHFVKYLSLLNVKYIVLRNDVQPKFTKCALSGNWDHQLVRNRLDNLQTENILKREGDSDVYILNDQFTLPKISIAKSVIYSDQKVEDLFQLVESTDSTLKTVFIFKDQNKDKNIFENDEESNPETSYERVNATLYKLVIKNAKSKFLLNFADNYDGHWVLSSMNKDWFQYFFPKEIVILNDHLVSNGFANAWIINPGELCKSGEIFCNTNEDGTFNFEMKLEFWPQKLFYLGAVLSGISILLFLSWVIVQNRKSLK